jgi:hypothetical protein
VIIRRRKPWLTPAMAWLAASPRRCVKLVVTAGRGLLANVRVEVQLESPFFLVGLIACQ